MNYVLAFRIRGGAQSSVRPWDWTHLGRIGELGGRIDPCVGQLWEFPYIPIRNYSSLVPKLGWNGKLPKHFIQITKDGQEWRMRLQKGSYLLTTTTQSCLGMPWPERFHEAEQERVNVGLNILSQTHSFE